MKNVGYDGMRDAMDGDSVAVASRPLPIQPFFYRFDKQRNCLWQVRRCFSLAIMRTVVVEDERKECSVLFLLFFFIV